MSSPLIGLERIGANEWKLWRDLRLQALREAPDAFGSTLAEWQDAPESRWIRRLESVPFNLIARPAGEPAGIVSCIEPHDGGVAELISLWVSPFARGRGIGDALIRAVIAWAAEQHASRVMLAVRAHNTRAIELYRRNGFADAGPHPDPDSACELVMIRNVD